MVSNKKLLQEVQEFRQTIPILKRMKEEKIERLPWARDSREREKLMKELDIIDLKIEILTEKSKI